MANIPFVDDAFPIQLISTPGTGFLGGPGPVLLLANDMIPDMLPPNGEGLGAVTGSLRNYKSIDWFFTFTFNGQIAPAQPGFPQPGEVKSVRIAIQHIIESPPDPSGNTHFFTMGIHNLEYSSILNAESPFFNETAEGSVSTQDSASVPHFLSPPVSTNPPSLHARGSMVIDVARIRKYANVFPLVPIQYSFILSTPIVGDRMAVAIFAEKEDGSSLAPGSPFDEPYPAGTGLGRDTAFVACQRRAHRECFWR